MVCLFMTLYMAVVCACPVSLYGLSLSSRRDAEKPYSPIIGLHATSPDMLIICVSLKDSDVGLFL